MSSRGPFVSTCACACAVEGGREDRLDGCTAQGMHVVCEEPRGPGVRVCVCVHLCVFKRAHMFQLTIGAEMDNQEGN